MNKILSLVFGGMVLAVMSVSPAPAFADVDLQLWNYLGIDYKLNDKWKLTLEPGVRSREDASELFYFETRQGVVYSVNKYLDLGTQWLLVNTKNSKDEWADQHSWELQGTAKWDLLGLKFSDRNRFEGKKVGTNGRWYYRNLLKLSKPIQDFPFGLTPFISNEIFYDLQASEYIQNRGSAGFSKKINDRMSMEVYYMLKNDRADSDTDWSQTNIIGTAIKISL